MPGISTGSTRVNQLKLLRVVYTNMLHRHFNSKSLLLQSLGRDNRLNMAMGEKFSIPIHEEMGSGYVANARGLLGPASHERINRAFFQPTMIQDRIQLDVSFQLDAASKAAAEKSPLGLQVEATVRNARRDLNFDLFGDGTGKLAIPKTATSATAMTIDPDVMGKYGLRTGKIVDVLKIATGAVAGGVAGAKIAYDPATSAITFLSGELADFADVHANPTTYAVYRHMSRNACVLGLQAAIRTGNLPDSMGNYGDIDRTLAENAFYRGNVHLNAGTPRAPSFKLLQDLIDDCQNRSDGVIDLVICPQQIWSYFAETLVQQRRYAGNMTKLRGWAEAIEFSHRSSEKPCYLVSDRDCPPDKIFVLDTSTWKIVQNSEGEWMDDDGAMLSRVDGIIGYEAAWYRRLQVVCTVPSANGILGEVEYTAPS